MAQASDHVFDDSDSSPAPPPKIRQLLAPEAGSSFERYRQLTCPGSIARLCLYELATMLLLPLPGALGLLLRRVLLKRFFGSMGRNVIIGRNCVFRHPQRIFIADDVVIDENCLLDARGSAADGIHLSKSVLVSRNVQIKSKGGPIHIGREVTIGDNSMLVSQSGIRIGDGAAIAGNCLIMGGTFLISEFHLSASKRMTSSAGPISVGAGAWLATGVLVMDAACIGNDSIISAGSVVSGPIAPKCVAHGNPAKRLFDIR